jgi:hypothetical protein
MPLAALALALLNAVSVAAGSPRWIEIGGGAWKPQAADLSNLERALRPAATAAAQSRGRMPPWQSYTFQYQGKRSLLGRRYIYVNAFCDDPKNHSLLEWVEVLDGGACFFHGKYDPQSGEIFDLVVNGVA